MISEIKVSEPPPSYSTPAPSPSEHGTAPIIPIARSQPPPEKQATAHVASPAELANIGKNYQAQLFAQCALGNHQATTEYGICGILTAIVLFPIGLICLFVDSHEKCSRCGERLRG